MHQQLRVMKYENSVKLKLRLKVNVNICKTRRDSANNNILSGFKITDGNYIFAPLVLLNKNNQEVTNSNFAP